jgi:MerC mercury resistance protein
MISADQRLLARSRTENRERMENSKANSTEVLDRAGMAASVACAVHCAALPLVLMALPALGLAWLDSEWVDWTMVVVAAVIAFRAHRGGLALHKKCLPVGVAALGIVVIMGAICLLKGSPSMHYLQASGATMVASSHWLNHRLCRSCATCRSRDASGHEPRS